MKILLDTALLAEQPLEASFEAVLQYGYDGLELGNRDDVIPANGPLALPFDALRGAGRRARAMGTDITSVAVIQQWADPDEDRRVQAVAYWLEGLRAALELGAHRVNTELTGDPGRSPQCRRALRRSLDELAPTLEREGVVVVVEPHPGDFLETTAEAVDLIEQAAIPQVRYLHCLPHTFHLGGSITEQVHLAGAALDHIHVADTFRPERTILNPANQGVRIHQHFDIGGGELDWGEASRALAEIGFDGLATVQVYGWKDRAAQSFAANRVAIGAVLHSASAGES